MSSYSPEKGGVTKSSVTKASEPFKSERGSAACKNGGLIGYIATKGLIHCIKRVGERGRVRAIPQPLSSPVAEHDPESGFCKRIRQKNAVPKDGFF